MEPGTDRANEPSSYPTTPSADPVRQPETGAVTRLPGSQFTARLAHRLGYRSENDLLARIPADTVRRLRYPVIERDDGEGGYSYEHPVV